MKKYKIIAILLLMPVFFTFCGISRDYRKSWQTQPENSTYKMKYLSAEESKLASRKKVNINIDSSGGKTKTKRTGQKMDGLQRLLIYNANFTILVKEIDKKIDEVISIAHKTGGYMQKRSQNTVVIRIPANKFWEVIKSLKKLGDVKSENIASSDVTEEYYDLEIRINNALAVRKRLEDLLKKANKVEEALKVERELERLSENIERFKGRIKYLKRQSALSTISIHFIKEYTPPPPKKTYNPGILGYPFYYLFLGLKYTAQGIVWLFVRSEDKEEKEEKK